jgi:adenylate cyclase, class 2
MNSQTQTPIEVELKFRVDDQDVLVARLKSLGAVPGATESHRDLYFRHPCRDFVQTREALRIRRVVISRTSSNGHLETESQSRVTYKGPHLPGGIKARHELEWELNPSDPAGSQLEELLIRLGFEPVTTVVKERQSMLLIRDNREVTIALDEVVQVGNYVEVEVLATDESDLQAARELVGRLAAELDLTQPESRSYLSLLLGKVKSPR